MSALDLNKVARRAVKRALPILPGGHMFVALVVKIDPNGGDPKISAACDRELPAEIVAVVLEEAAKSLRVPA